MAGPDPGYCLFGSGVLGKYAEHLAAEAEGVRTAADIEHIHRMRVASRRLRAALPIFAECFGKATYRRWRREIREVTRALGAARDADVQIEFLRSYLESLPPAATPFSTEGAPALAQPPHGRLVPGAMVRMHRPSPPPLRTGVECLLLRLSQRRAALQPAVAAAMDDLEAAGTVGEIAAACREGMAGTGVHSAYAFEQAFIHISLCLDDLFSHAASVADPAAKEEHHAMRIAAKRLRYTMETFAPLYPGELKSEIAALKKLQDYLGDIHDCDVWAAFLPVFLEEERERCRTYFGHDGVMAAIEPGILHLGEERVARRRALFDDFAVYWAELGKSGSWRGICGPVKIALIGDVHANLPALQAVLRDAHERGAIAVLDAGDAVGYGPFPEETVEHLRRQRVLSVIGNYDRQVLASRGKKKGLPKDPEKRLAVLWAYEHLSKEGRSSLASLPEHRRLAPGGRRILLCHGSPDAIDEYLDGDTPASRLAEIARTAGADIVVSGHAHRPSAREVGGVWFVNTGSVGRPDDGDPRACYALLQTEPFSVCHLRVPYDVDRTVAAVLEGGLPPSFARIFLEGRSLDALDRGEVSVSCTVEEDDEEG
ncbi:CHAD domain-containing protein [Methanofollis tationis]|uniref:CHAD domain-containing protein n=1 Tax=Methanofollis tationis TaxID=81417 RepID=A0A7K4HPF5_9EURY|nr:CHAD domain-containing protein [Methanofollis tationis]NVO66947.1 CHAD domain-containing protein [Methanofollis tationis]